LSSSDHNKKTPLYEIHRSLKAKMIPFGGWLMPVSYSSVLNEHKAVREQCGIFDVSHMGEIFVKGPKASDFIQKMTVNDVRRLHDCSGQYSALLNPKGGIIDDVIVYCLTSETYLICVNASNIDKDFDWLQGAVRDFEGAQVTNESAKWSQLAIQGPNSKKAVGALIPASDTQAFSDLDYMQIMWTKLHGHDSLVARTGYTGEWGYEIYLPNAAAELVWNQLMAKRSETGLQPIGLGARDTLRLEACYNLYGNDMNDSISPLEAGIAWAVRMDTDDFVGKSSLLEQKAKGVPRSLQAFTMEEEGIPRHDMEVFTQSGERLGVVTSGSVLPTLGGAGGLVLIDAGKAQVGDQFLVDIRGKRKLARLVKKPLYKAKTKG
jgi:aminomethyltransferase